MESNEYKILESLILYHKRKNDLELTRSVQQINDRINRVVEKMNDLNTKVDKLLDELKPITSLDILERIEDKIVTHGNWNEEEEFDYTNR